MAEDKFTVNKFYILFSTPARTVHINCSEEQSNACSVLLEKSLRKRLLGRTRSRWRILRNWLLRNAMGWIHEAQDEDKRPDETFGR